MTSEHRKAPREDELIDAVARVLADPAYDDNPLRTLLDELFELSSQQRERMEKLVRISDSFQDFYRERNEDLAASYDRHLRRLERLVRISDRYQENLREINASLQETALQDPLTGLGNRRFAMERLTAEMNRSRRQGEALGLALLDIDHFKSFNDDFGHDVGDQVLRAVADAIRDSLREYDLCGRWGGEEFLLIFPGTNLEEASMICERIRTAIAGITLPAGASGQWTNIAASIGLVQVTADETENAAIKRADHFMLTAKRAGRDRLLRENNDATQEEPSS